MKRFAPVAIAAALVLLLLLSACSEIKYTVPEDFKDGDQLLMPSEGELIAIFDTSMGEMRVRLFPAQAPKAVENFRKLAERGYYNDITFHRVVSDFIVQSGDPTGTGSGGVSVWGKGFADEFDTGLYHYYGALSYARASKAESGEKNMSQFFFVTKNDKYYDVDKNQLLKRGYPEAAADGYLKARGDYSLDALYNRYDEDESYVVFGQLYEGFEVLAAIDAVETSDQKPVADVLLSSVTITTYSKEG